MGPLNLHYLPSSMFACFRSSALKKFFIWNAANHQCFEGAVQATSSGYLAMAERPLHFKPQLSPLAFDQQGQVLSGSAWRFFAKTMFESAPHLFLMGDVGVAYFNKDQSQWETSDLKAPVVLPWMGFELSLKRHEKYRYPALVPVAQRPIQDGGELIQGAERALEVEIEGKNFWVTRSRPLALETSQGEVRLSLTKQTLPLPFSFLLEQFQMDKDPGTNNPASYESLVTVSDQGLKNQHRIFMNNPLKKAGLTFYQASYFPLDNGDFGSVLSVNLDPGRPWKYFGSLLLVLGAIYHYYLNRKRYQKVKL